MVGREADSSTVEPLRHWKVTTPRRFEDGPPAMGASWKLQPPWRAEDASPTAMKLELAPVRSTHLLLLALRYCRAKLMYILPVACFSPGIEPRMPTVLGWSVGSQTSIVAHSSRECSSARWALALSPREGLCDAATAGTAGTHRAPAVTTETMRRLVALMRLTIAAAACESATWRAVWYSVAMAATSATEIVELLGRVPVFSTLELADLERIAQLAVPRSFEPGQIVFREGDASDTCYVVRDGHARAIRTHGDGRTITLATFGPGDIFGELAMFEDERRSATVEAVGLTSVVAVLGPDMRRLMNQHPTIATRLVIALGRRLREMNERLSRQSFQTVQSRVAVVLSELVAQEIADGHGPKDVTVTATQADLAQLAGSSRESASRFLAVLERAGVITQGRGRLVVRDADALRQYVF